MSDFSNILYHTVIEFLTLEKVQPQHIHNQMTVVYGDDMQALSCWVLLRQNHSVLRMSPVMRHPSEAVRRKLLSCRKYHFAKLSKQCASDIWHREPFLGIRTGLVKVILHEHFLMTKDCTCTMSPLNVRPENERLSMQSVMYQLKS